MLNMRPWLTWVAAAFGLLAVAGFAVGFNDLALVLLGLGYAGLCFDFRKFTGRAQFISMLVLGSALGLALDFRFGTWPLGMASALFSVLATVLRQAFMARFTYVRLLWVEPLLVILAVGCQGIVITVSDPSWQSWALPFLPIGSAAILAMTYLQDGLVIRKRNRFGYRIQVGEQAPPIELPDPDGNIVRLSDYRDQHPVLLVFVRGDWCPGCHMMLRTYEKRREEFLRKGVHVLAIGPDDIGVNKDMVSRFGVGYKLLSDVEQRVSRQFGVVYTNPLLEQGVDYAQGIPLPASFLVDRSGIVRYVSRPDRVGEFLEPSLIFGVLNALPENAGDPWQKRA